MINFILYILTCCKTKHTKDKNMYMDSEWFDETDSLSEISRQYETS